jgi:hypothetical protein
MQNPAGFFLSGHLKAAPGRGLVLAAQLAGCRHPGTPMNNENRFLA